MRDGILKARIKVVGGEKLIETFDDFGKHGAVAMRLVDREAEKASKEVSKLKRELDALDRAARHIRASIKVDKKRGITPSQAASLATADKMEAIAAAHRPKLLAAEQAFAIDPGLTARTFSKALDDGVDLFDSKKLGAEIADALREADIGEAILPTKARNDIMRVVDNFDKKTVSIRDDLHHGITTKDRKAEEVRLKKEEDERIANAEREKKRLNDSLAVQEKARAQSEDRIRADADRENLRRDKAAATRAEFAARRRVEAEKKADREIEEAFAWNHHQRSVLEKEEELLRQKRVATEKLDIGELERRRKKADREHRVRQKLGILPDVADAPDAKKPRVKAPDIPDASGNISKSGKAASKAAKDMAAFEKATSRAGKAMKGVKGGGGLGKLFSGISRYVNGTLGDLKKFTTALGSLEYALGNVALRTGVAGIIGAIAVALAALGGGAALAGIAAIAGLAAFDAAKLERGAKALNMTLEDFTALRYAAARSGVAYDDYDNSLKNVRKTLLDIHKGEKSAADAAALAARYGIEIYSADRQDVASAKSIIAQVTKLYHSFPEGQQRTHLLEAFGLLELEPLIRKNIKGIDELIARAAKVGVVLSKVDVEKWEEMRSALWDTWEILKGMGYKLASQISPDLMPVLEAINKWLLDNSDKIVTWLVDSFNYLVAVVRDFWGLFKNRKNIEEFVPAKAWTKQVWQFGDAVVGAFTTAWKAIEKAYDIAHPALQKLGEALYGTNKGNEGLKLTLTAIGASLLGIPSLVTSFVRTISAAFGIVFGAAKRFLLPVLETVFGIVGWPVLLAGTATMVWAYWDDVKAAAASAWDYFKTTFPGTAKVLEDAYTKAKPYVDSFFDSFAEKYPNLAGLGEDVSNGLQSVQDRLAQWDWGEMGKDGLSLLSYLIENTFKSLDTLKPLMEYFVVNFVDSIFTLLEGLGKVYGWLKKIFTEFASGSGKPSIADEALNTATEKTGIASLYSYVAKLFSPEAIQAAAYQVSTSLDVSTDFIDTRQIPMELQAPAPAAVYQIDWTTPAGDTLSTYTKDPTVGRKLNAGQAALSRNPTWNGRRF